EGNAIQIKLLLAELYDMESRTPEMLKVYRELLAQKDATPIQLAIVDNNLAFQLALAGGADNAKEALKHIEDAIRVIGPTSDLLDTRGLSYLASGDTAKAIADLNAAATDAPAPAKYIHLAWAQSKANDLDAAHDTLAKAQKLGVVLEQLTPSDRQMYN